MTDPAPLSHTKLKHFRKLKNRKHRALNRLFFAEGFRQFTAALSSEIEIETVLVSDHFVKNKNYKQILRESADSGFPVYHCTEAQMRELSDDVSPPGIMIITPYHDKNRNHLDTCSENKILYLENISDPGNLGTIIRTAVWFNIKTIFLSPKCVDPTNPKAVRATAGAIFYANLFSDIPPDMMFTFFKQRRYQFAASSASGNVSVSDWQPGDKCILFLGSEAHGLSQEVMNKCDKKIKIPGNTEIESLNLAVAAGIFCNKLGG